MDNKESERKLRPPRTVKIGPTRFKIRRKRSLKLDGEAVDGYISFSDSEIFLDSKLSLGTEQMTILHEVLHGFFQYSGMHLSSDQEHKYIELLSANMLTLIQDNSGLVKYLKKRNRKIEQKNKTGVGKKTIDKDILLTHQEASKTSESSDDFQKRES